MRPAERLAALGAIISLASLPMPWYRVVGLPTETRSGFSVFGFATAALILTLGAGLYLLLGVDRERRPNLPLHEGTLLAICGAWAMLIIVALAFDRPVFATGTVFENGYSLGLGFVVAFTGAAIIFGSGLRVRAQEIREGAPGPKP